MNNSYRKIQDEFNQVFSLPPNDLGNRKLTFVYKFITHPLKRMPFLYIVPLSLLVAAGLYFLFGQFVIKLVSTLQNGF